MQRAKKAGATAKRRGANRGSAGSAVRAFVERRVAGGMRFVFALVEGGGPRARLADGGSGRPVAGALQPREPARRGEPRRGLSGEEPGGARRDPRRRVGEPRHDSRSSTPFLQELVDGFDRIGRATDRSRSSDSSMCIALRDSGKPAILFGAHLGNFELTPALGRQARPAGDRPVPAADQPPHRRRDREPAEQLSRPDGGVGPRRGTGSGRRAEEGPAHRRAHRPADRAAAR